MSYPNSYPKTYLYLALNADGQSDNCHANVRSQTRSCKDTHANANAR
jgi:hypothetical protein